MSRLRHEKEHEKHGEHEMHHERHKRAHGGRSEVDKEEPESYTAGDPEVEKEAKERKHGGRAKKAHGGHIEGHKARHRLDRPGRKRGGSVGADMHPLSTAAKIEKATEHKADMGNAEGED